MQCRPRPSCKITFDKVFSYNEDNSKLAKVTESISGAIEDECQLRHYQENCPGLLKTLKDAVGISQAAHNSVLSPSVR